MKKCLFGFFLIASIVSIAQQRPPAPPAPPVAPTAPAASEAKPNPANIPFNPDQIGRAHV